MVLAVLAVQPAAGAEKPIDINKAPVSELITINGIGNAKAQAIIEYREKNGSFKSVDELTLVHGIGDKTLERLRPQVDEIVCLATPSRFGAIGAFYDDFRQVSDDEVVQLLALAR
jgi:competence ComEA-like helix-hairpin-helix protein